MGTVKKYIKIDEKGKIVKGFTTKNLDGINTIDFVSSFMPIMNAGGYKKGQIVYFYGSKDCGKTQVLGKEFRNLYSEGNNVIYSAPTRYVEGVKGNIYSGKKPPVLINYNTSNIQVIILDDFDFSDQFSFNELQKYTKGSNDNRLVIFSTKQYYKGYHDKSDICVKIEKEDDNISLTVTKSLTNAENSVKVNKNDLII